MKTEVLTPQKVFMQPQRLMVPLFQRPYVWNRETQWQPLWDDLVRVASCLLASGSTRPYPHFLGAVVLQQTPSLTGLMQERTIIDGQQRLTTLQLLLDALHAELIGVRAEAAALRIEPLINNAEPFRTRPEDRFKVWPTNRDRPAFNAVMGAEPPVNHDTLGPRGERMVEAHRFFSMCAREWLAAGGGSVEAKANAIETAARDQLQLVVIDLSVDENAQEIFETLNARGSQLTAADLIKNFVFQRLLESGSDVEKAYEQHWKDFETAFWETEVNVGRVRYPRSSLFLNHWLVARTGEEVLAREVFSRFKSYADHDSGARMPELIQQVERAAGVYRSFVTAAGTTEGHVDRLGLFGYRTGVLESEVIKPLILALRDPEREPITADVLVRVLDIIESWMVRRMLVRATTKSYTQVVVELIALLQNESRHSAGRVIERYFAGQTTESRYWPDDEEIRATLKDLPAYRRLGRGRLRMVLEAVEDHLRGWRDGKEGLGGERVSRGRHAIEHVMPRKWTTHWPLPRAARAEDRDQFIHTIGNLTLLNGKLNTRVSNGPWLGRDGKRAGLEGHDALLLNRALLKAAGRSWSEAAIRSRTEELTTIILQVWPVPRGHKSGPVHERPQGKQKVGLADLLSAGFLPAGATLHPRPRKYSAVKVQVLPDGRIDVEGVIYATPSKAASAIAGRPKNGWGYFWVNPIDRRSLRDLRLEYIESLSVDDSEPDEVDDGNDDDD